jgi:acyl dehydratase
MVVRWDDVEVGTELPPLRVELRRADLVRYAGASGDFNPIHWDEQFAVAAGLPGVIAHGMLTMAQAGRLVTDWAGDADALVSIGVRFTRPVVVPYQDAAVLELAGTVTDKQPGGQVTVGITARFDGRTVLAKAQAVVRLSPSGSV